MSMILCEFSHGIQLEIGKDARTRVFYGCVNESQLCANPLKTNSSMVAGESHDCISRNLKDLLRRSPE